MDKDSQLPKTLKQVFCNYFEIDDDIIAEIDKICSLVKLKKNKNIINQGDVCRDIIIVRTGMMWVRHLFPKSEDTLLFGSSGDVYAAIHSFFASKPALYSLTAVTDAEVWVIKYEDWTVLENRYPVLIKWMRDLLLEQCYSLEERHLRFKTKSIEELFLNFLNKDQAGISRRTTIKTINKIVPLKYIAQYLSITPESLSRLRNKLVRESSKESQKQKNAGKD